MKIILFDVGGTLMDTKNDLFTVISSDIDIQKKFKEQFFLEKSLLSSNDFKNVKELLSLCERKLAIKNNVSIEASYTDIYLNKIYLFDGVLEVLSKFKNRGYRLIIVSDADSDILIPQLKTLGIYDYFSNLVISSDVKGYKPGKEICNEIIKYISEEDEIYFVGDSIVDIQTGKIIGAKSILINFSNEIKNYSQDYTICNIKDLLKIIN